MRRISFHPVTFRGDKIARFEEFFDTYAAGEAFRPEAETGS